ncbi:MAG: dTDP-4-dehydrorhamnose 3,5-epimerase [Fibromonadales bacterium]|nr:dTDP-4-dehydrorhamnose 3,5-epimerase [Fibromonadales bacterium]
MQIIKTEIEGLLIIEPSVYPDSRGWFYESYNAEKFKAFGIDTIFVQDNHSRSVKNTLRGLHYQKKPGQVKLVRCTLGKIWDVAVDIRKDSPTFGKWFALELSEENKKFLYIPIGFAHGFCVLSDVAEVQYKCSSVYNGAEEAGFAWNSPNIGIKWPVSEPILSQRDLLLEPLP